MRKFHADYYLKKAHYHGWGVDNSQLDKERVSLLKQFLIGKKILDIGCGYGTYVDFISKLNFESYGIDFVKEFIEYAKKNREGKFLVGSAEELPFSNNSFDTILLFDILEHGDDEIILKEAKRCASKRIVLIVPRKVDERLEKAGVIFRHYLDKSHIREYSRNDLINLFKKVNLKLINLQPVHNLYNETIFLSLFGGNIVLKKIIRKIVFFLLPKQVYPTEYFAVLEK